MATSRLESAWTSYEEAIRDFYDLVGFELERGLGDDQIDGADGMLDRAASSSEELRKACAELLEGPSDRDPEDVELLLLAAAALDSMLAADGLTLDPERPGLDESYTEGAVFAEREAEPREVVIAAANYLYQGFLGISGAADPADGPQLRGVCLGAVDTLISAAAKPALRFTFHGFSAPAAGFVVDSLGQVAGFAASASRIRGPALRLLYEALEKFLEILGHQEIEKAIEWVFEPIRGVLSNAGAAILGRVGGRADAEARITGSINDVPAWERGELGSVNLRVNQLTNSYVDLMKRTGRVATGIARAAPVVSVLAQAPGLAAVVGINAIGLGFVSYTLTVRVGSRGVPHPRGMVGIVTIVEQRGS